MGVHTPNRWACTTLILRTTARRGTPSNAVVALYYNEALICMYVGVIPATQMGLQLRMVMGEIGCGWRVDG